MENKLWASLYEQEHCEILGRGVWHYLVDTAIGQFHIVEYEAIGKEIKRHIIDSDNDKAAKLFRKIGKDMLNERL